MQERPGGCFIAFDGIGGTATDQQVVLQVGAAGIVGGHGDVVGKPEIGIDVVDASGIADDGLDIAITPVHDPAVDDLVGVEIQGIGFAVARGVGARCRQYKRGFVDAGDRDQHGIGGGGSVAVGGG